MLSNIKKADTFRKETCHENSSILIAPILKVSCAAALSLVVSVASSFFFRSQMNAGPTSFGYGTAFGTGAFVGTVSRLNLNEGVALVPLAICLGILGQVVKSNMAAFFVSSAIFGYVIGKNRGPKRVITPGNFFGNVSKKTVIATIAASGIISSVGLGARNGLLVALVTTLGAAGGSLLVKGANGLSHIESLAKKIANSGFVNSIFGKISGIFYQKNKKNAE